MTMADDKTSHKNNIFKKVTLISADLIFISHIRHGHNIDVKNCFGIGSSRSIQFFSRCLSC